MAGFLGGAQLVRRGSIRLGGATTGNAALVFFSCSATLIIRLICATLNIVLPTGIIKVTAKPIPSFEDMQPSPGYSEINTPEATSVIDLSQY